MQCCEGVTADAVGAGGEADTVALGVVPSGSTLIEMTGSVACFSQATTTAKQAHRAQP